MCAAFKGNNLHENIESSHKHALLNKVVFYYFQQVASLLILPLQNIKGAILSSQK